MLPQQEFYFVRHGQTDHNISEGTLKSDHSDDISLNDTGRNQAKLIAPIISTLPIQAVSSSPLRRVQETKEILLSNLQIVHDHIQEDLGDG